MLAKTMTCLPLDRAVGWSGQVSAGGACAGGWTSGEFPDAFPFHCGSPVTNGQRANMYGCNSGPLAQSGYTPGAQDDVCGCPDWVGWGVESPPISDCVGVNDEWVAWSQPWAHYLKRACPTAYTFPYDDQTSTFDCSDADGSEDSINTQSCESIAPRVVRCPRVSESRSRRGWRGRRGGKAKRLPPGPRDVRTRFAFPCDVSGSPPLASLSARRPVVACFGRPACLGQTPSPSARDRRSRQCTDPERVFSTGVTSGPRLS